MILKNEIQKIQLDLNDCITTKLETSYNSLQQSKQFIKNSPALISHIESIQKQIFDLDNLFTEQAEIFIEINKIKL